MLEMRLVTTSAINYDIFTVFVIKEKLQSISHIITFSYFIYFFVKHRLVSVIIVVLCIEENRV